MGPGTLTFWILLLFLVMLLPAAGCVERNLAPIAVFVAGTPVGTADITVTFDATRSFDDSAIVDFVWDFGDGSPPRTLRGDEGRAPSHTYLVGSKSVTVSLTVVDDDGVSSEPFSLRVVLANQVPTAAFVVASAEGLIVTFDASGSSDPDPGESDRLTYRWQFGDVPGEVPTEQPTIQHHYPGRGLYTVRLTVNDGSEDSTPAFRQVEVEEAR